MDNKMFSKPSKTLKRVRQDNSDERPPIDKKTLEKYSRGPGMKARHFRNGHKKDYFQGKEIKYKEAEENAARAEILLTETPGVLEARDFSYTSHITQNQIKKAVDITAAAKSFDLHLTEFGPYKFRYSNDGRHMVLAGRKGHLSSFDWITKHLNFEINIMESIHDVCFLHTEQMMAAAQKDWTYIYDSQGIELHCIKHMEKIKTLEFLPYHFLLTAGSESGFLSWLDVTLGKEVLQVQTSKGRLSIMCQNPSNGVICCGHTNGTVTMWTPNHKKPALSMLCHPQPIQAIAVDSSGKYFATSSVNSECRIWDTRNLGTAISAYKMRAGVNRVAFSQSRMLGIAYKDFVEVYKDITVQSNCEIYMKHRARSLVTDLQFCPYEDVLGCSTNLGFSSLIIPGSGEPNFDALEANPFKSTSARREAEVKAVLEKVPYELITLDGDSFAQVDVPTLEEKLEAKKLLHWVKVPKVDVMPRYRMKGKSGSANKFKRKMRVKEDEKREYLKFIREKKQQLKQKEEKEKEKAIAPKEKTVEILDRFKSKR